MTIKTKRITAIHTKDPAWLISLYLAIYGGDPPREGYISAEKVNEAATAMIRAFAAHLNDPVKAKAVATAVGR